MKVLILIFTMLGIFALDVKAQKPRTVSDSPSKTAPPKVAPAPDTVKAKYEGGVFGYNKTMEGTLSFDDTNSRLVFKKANKEVFFIPYKAVTSAFAERRDATSGSNRCERNSSIYAWPAQLSRPKCATCDEFYEPDSM